MALLYFIAAVAACLALARFCFDGGHWRDFPPSRRFVRMGAYILLAPLVSSLIFYFGGILPDDSLFVRYLLQPLLGGLSMAMTFMIVALIVWAIVWFFFVANAVEGLTHWSMKHHAKDNQFTRTVKSARVDILAGWVLGFVTWYGLPLGAWLIYKFFSFWV